VWLRRKQPDTGEKEGGGEEARGKGGQGLGCSRIPERLLKNSKKERKGEEGILKDTKKRPFPMGKEGKERKGGFQGLHKSQKEGEKKKNNNK